MLDIVISLCMLTYAAIHEDWFQFPGQVGIGRQMVFTGCIVGSLPALLAAIVRPSPGDLNIRDDAGVFQYVHSCL